MNYLDEFLLIAIAHFFAVASPGPDFAVVLKQSIQQGRRNALWTSAGVGAAILLHVGYCVLGVALILTQSPNLFMTLKLVCQQLSYKNLVLYCETSNICYRLQVLSTKLRDRHSILEQIPLAETSYRV